MRVAVLMGGVSSERGVSLSTGQQILESLDPDKYEAVGVDTALMAGSRLRIAGGAEAEVEAVAQAGEALLKARKLHSLQDVLYDNDLRPEVAFVALHGKYGEDGTIQGLLELVGIPYTGSGVLASALAMDKAMAKKVLAADGLPVAPSVDFTLTGGDWDRAAVAERVRLMGYPAIVKPSRQGSTIGMTKVCGESELAAAISRAAVHDRRILVERFIEGKELTVGVLGNDEPYALPVIEIVPAKGFYDYEAKYTPGATEEIVPARISEEETNAVQRLAVAAHRSLGCSGVSRVDFIMNEHGCCILEVNTIPGMTPTSLLPRAAAAAGITFPGLLDRLIGYALEEGSDK